jgi:DNA-directed RNA polymerase sigma subunit (sigma70/sigma32)
MVEVIKEPDINNEGTAERPKSKRKSKLQKALGNLSLQEVAPDLSEEQMKILFARFKLLGGGGKRRTLVQAAEVLGITKDEVHRIENEAIEQILVSSMFLGSWNRR